MVQLQNRPRMAVLIQKARTATAHALKQGLFEMTVRATAPMLPTPLLAVGTDPQHLEVALADAGVGIGGLGQERCAALAWLINMNVA